MYGRGSKSSRKSVIRMDPDCAVCQAPATEACECEAKVLEQSIKAAEERMMKSIYSDIRKWVRAHAQDYVLEYFRQLAERRKASHSALMEHIHSQARYYYNAPPHPDQLADAQAALKRGIDEDWQASVERYPEVLEYFFGLVELTLPADDEPAVKEPPLIALGGHRKANRRSGVPIPAGVPGMAIPTTSLAPPMGYHEAQTPRPRTPSAIDRRTPALRGGGRTGVSYRPVMAHAPPPAPQSYYGLAHAPHGHGHAPHGHAHAPYIN